MEEEKAIPAVFFVVLVAGVISLIVILGGENVSIGSNVAPFQKSPSSC